MKELKKTTYICKNLHSRCRVVFLYSSISALFLYFFQVHAYLKWTFSETFLLSFCSFLRGFYTNFHVTQQPNAIIASDECVLRWRQTLLVLETNAFELQPHTCTGSYRWLPNRTYVKMITTDRYSPLKTGGIMLSYSPLEYAIIP